MIDGVANTVYNYADILTKNNYKCTVVTPKYPNIKDSYDFDVERYSSIVASKNLEYRVGNILPAKTLAKLNSKKFDLIHVHSPFVSSVIAEELKAINPNIPMVLTYHTKFDVEIEERIKVKSFSKIAKKFVLRNIKAADEIWVVSEGAAESLKNLGYKGAWRVMKNGTDFKKGASSEKKINNLRKKLGIEDDEFVFLFVGRMMLYKNTNLILDALSLLPQDLKFKMIFVGDGIEKSEIEKYSEQVGISNRCIFTGAIHDREILRDYYSISDLFIFPSTYDTSGLVVMEAAATKLPSVLIKKSCAAEGITHKRNGFLCEENKTSLKDTILEAIQNKELLKQVGENAQNEIYYSWEDSVKNATKRYDELIEKFKKG